MKNIDKTISEILECEYVVPLYQRSFTWGEKELTQLLQDIYSSYKRDKNSNYYIGSLVVLKRGASSKYEVIDGQQRLTSISLIAKIIGSEQLTQKLFFDSREDVNVFLEEYYKVDWTEAIKPESSIRNEFNVLLNNINKAYNSSDKNQLTHFNTAIDIIAKAKLDAELGDDSVSLSTINSEEREEFSKYFYNNVILVFVAMPTDTKVASYFEVMNNRGEQLQKHEILKARMMNNIKSLKGNESEDASVFALIWDACSQMNIEVQRSFEAKVRSDIFGPNFDDLDLKQLHSVLIKSLEESEKTTKATIDQVLAQSNVYNEPNNRKPLEVISESIIDFPNFLMHVFRVLYNNSETNSISLDEKYLLSVYKDIESDIDPMEFIYELLYYRVVFDKYVVRSVVNDNNSDEDSIRWSLRRPYKYSSDSGVHFKNTFGEELEDNIALIGNRQDRIIKCLSMLQVSYNTRVYKNWLQKVLLWFSSHKNINIPANDYIRALDNIALEHYDAVEEKRDKFKEDNNGNANQGTGTSNYLFNFVDYLYWVAVIEKMELEGVDFLKYVSPNFNFKYLNSVEHHYPQAHGKEVEGWLHSLGNLCLVSSSANSSMNKNEASRKAKDYYSDTLSPKRKIMYDITKEFGWSIKEIKQHDNEVNTLLNKRRDILGSLKLDLSSNDTIRALLSVGDISINCGSTWGGERRTIKGDENHIQVLESYKIVQKWQQNNPNNSLSEFYKEQLQTNLELQLPENNWRKTFIQYPEIVEYMNQGCYGWLDDGKYIILLQDNVASAHKHRELLSFILFLNLKSYNKYKLYSYGKYCRLYLNNSFRPLSSTDDYSNNYLEFWIDRETLKWCYKLHTDKHGNMIEIKHLKDNGWILHPEKFYYKKEQQFLVSERYNYIEENIEAAISKIDIILDEFKYIFHA